MIHPIEMKSRSFQINKLPKITIILGSSSPIFRPVLCNTRISVDALSLVLFIFMLRHISYDGELLPGSFNTSTLVDVLSFVVFLFV